MVEALGFDRPHTFPSRAPDRRIDLESLKQEVRGRPRSSRTRPGGTPP